MPVKEICQDTIQTLQAILVEINHVVKAECENEMWAYYLKTLDIA